MNDQGQWKPDAVKDMKMTGNILVFLIHAWAATHRAVFSVPGTVGFRYFGAQALVGMVLPWLLVLFWGQHFHGGEWLFRYWYLLLGLYLLHRLATSTRISRGGKVHSYFVGQSWWERIFPSWGTSTTMGLMELLSAIGIGCLLLPVCEPLGVFVMGGGVANAISLSIIQTRDDRMVEEAVNQEINARYYAQKIREKIGEDN